MKSLSHQTQMSLASLASTVAVALLVIGFIQVISLLVHSSTLMIEAKRAQLKHRMIAMKKKKKK